MSSLNPQCSRANVWVQRWPSVVYNDLNLDFPTEWGGGGTSPEQKAQIKMLKNKSGLTIALSHHYHKILRLLPDVQNILGTIIWLPFYLHLKSNKTNSVLYYIVQSRGIGEKFAPCITRYFSRNKNLNKWSTNVLTCTLSLQRIHLFSVIANEAFDLKVLCVGISSQAWLGTLCPALWNAELLTWSPASQKPWRPLCSNASGRVQGSKIASDYPITEMTLHRYNFYIIYKLHI